MVLALDQTPSWQALHDSLDEAADRLRYRLTAPVTGRERDWATAIAEALHEAERALRRYRAVTYSEDGPLTETSRIRTTLLRQWTGLCQDYQKLLEEVGRLRGEARRAAQAFQPVGETLAKAASAAPLADSSAVPDFGSIRQQAEQLLAKLDRHRDTETALLLESVTTDIGVGD